MYPLEIVNPMSIDDVVKAVKGLLKNSEPLVSLVDLSKDKRKDILYVISEPSPYRMAFIGKTLYGPNPEHQCYFERSSMEDIYIVLLLNLLSGSYL